MDPVLIFVGVVVLLVLFLIGEALFFSCAAWLWGDLTRL